MAILYCGVLLINDTTLKEGRESNRMAYHRAPFVCLMFLGRIEIIIMFSLDLI
jgi:hypothetical protein